MLKLRFANKEHGDVWLVEPSVLIGSDIACQASLKNAGIQSRHADIRIKGDQLTLVNVAGDKTITINGRAVDKQADLQVGDTIVIAGVQMLIVDPKTEAKPLSNVPESSGWAIRPNHSALANKVYSINGTTVLGRDKDECDLTFSVTHLSRKHAQLSIVNGQLLVKDLESTNGTFVNGEKITKEVKLKKGDELRLDALSFTIIGPGAEGDKTTVRAAVVPLTTAGVAQPAPKPAAQPAHAPVQGIQREKKPVAAHAPAQGNTAASAGKSDGGTATTWIIVGVALVVVAGALAYFLTR